MSRPILALYSIIKHLMRDLQKSSHFLPSTCSPMLKGTRCMLMISRCIENLHRAIRLCKLCSQPKSSTIKSSWIHPYTRVKRSSMKDLSKGFSIIRARLLTIASILMNRKDTREWCPHRCNRELQHRRLAMLRWARVVVSRRKLTRRKARTNFRKVRPTLLRPPSSLRIGHTRPKLDHSRTRKNLRL